MRTQHQQDRNQTKNGGNQEEEDLVSHNQKVKEVIRRTREAKRAQVRGEETKTAGRVTPLFSDIVTGRQRYVTSALQQEKEYT